MVPHMSRYVHDLQRSIVPVQFDEDVPENQIRGCILDRVGEYMDHYLQCVVGNVFISSMCCEERVHIFNVLSGTCSYLQCVVGNVLISSMCCGRGVVMPTLVG